MKEKNFQRFLDQFKDVMILILIAAAIISFVIACVEGNPKEFFEPVLILLIITCSQSAMRNSLNNLIIVFFQKEIFWKCRTGNFFRQ